MNSHLSYALTQARVAELARDNHRARRADGAKNADERDVAGELPYGASTRLRRWVGRIRAPQAVEGRGSAAA